MKPLNKILVVAPLALAVGAGAWFLGRMTAVKDETISVSFEAVVTKVVDGDTVVAAGGDHVRLLGIDADEKGYPCYDAARLRLEELVLGKNVMLESDSEDADQYGRKLRYIFLDGANINEKMAAEGLAVARFYPENQKYKSEITAAETAARKNGTGCKWNGRAQTVGAAVANGGASGNNYEWKNITGSAIEPCSAGDNIGKEAIIEGLVAEAYRSDSETVFLNFGAKYPNNCFTAVIFKSSLVNFSEKPENDYSGKIVRIKGKITQYEGKPEIILKSATQIEIGANY